MKKEWKEKRMTAKIFPALGYELTVFLHCEQPLFNVMGCPNVNQESGRLKPQVCKL